MRFLSELHRSIFDPAFYWEVLHFKKTRIVFFIVKLLIFTSLLSGLAKTYYLTHPQRGISAQVEALFSGIEIENGRLYVNRAVPYVAPKELVASVMDRLVGVPNLFQQLPDTFLVVDTRADSEWRIESNPQIIMRNESVLVDMKTSQAVIPYEQILGGKKDFAFTASKIQDFFNSYFSGLVVHFVFWNLFFGASSVVLSVFFLSLAAYLFRADKLKRFSHFLKLACFSISPILVGTSLVALSGVRAEWTWHFFIIISTVVMFRAMAYTSARERSEEKKKGLE
ncbi:MAG: DUF1189 family protein [Chitinispirillaceae bacterium]